jgi:hypothetical protein
MKYFSINFKSYPKRNLIWNMWWNWIGSQSWYCDLNGYYFCRKNNKYFLLIVKQILRKYPIVDTVDAKSLGPAKTTYLVKNIMDDILTHFFIQLFFFLQFFLLFVFIRLMHIAPTFFLYTVAHGLDIRHFKVLRYSF